MVEQSRTTKRQSKKRDTRRYLHFYLDGLLHKVLFVSRPQDLVWCWSYTERKRVNFAWSYVRKHWKRAYSTKEVAAMVNRTPRSINKYWEAKAIRFPQHTYGLTEIGRTHAYKWNERDILDLHEYLLSVNQGRPRKDGLLNIRPMPTKAELLAMLRNEVVTYIKNENDEFIPIWKEPEW